MRTLLLLLCSLIAAAAHGAPAKVAVLPIESPDDGTALRLQKALRAGIEANPQITDAGPVGMSLDEARMSFSCFEGQPDCMSQVGEVLRVDQLLWGRLGQVDDQWVFELHLVDVKGKTALRDGRVAGIGPDRVDALEKVARAFAAGEAEPAVHRVALTVSAEPKGSVVRVDGRKVGRTPLTIQVDPGVHAVGVSNTGYVADERMVRVDREPVSVTVVLSPDSVAQANAAQGPTKQGLSTRTWWAIGLGAVAATAGGVGIVMGVEAENLADEGQRLLDELKRTSDPALRERHAETKSDFDRTKLTSNVSWAVAGVAAGAAIGLLVWDVLDPEPSAATVAPTPNGFVFIQRF
ncbi:MAG: PEGA domain-containing protein [Myxococcales bacterium]|nr:PEGA domain-containing protein [Myxococcales bacterium]MCB9521922.1 PEGA domain-containing protein [Myxococcales bacterium]